MNIIALIVFSLSLLCMIPLIAYNWFFMIEVGKIEEELEVLLPKILSRFLNFNAFFSVACTVVLAFLLLLTFVNR